jgi:hypothetical protein
MAPYLTPEEEAANEMMGRIIAEWQDVESELLGLLEYLLHAPDRYASVVFYSITSFPLRLKIIDTLIRLRFGNETGSRPNPKRIKDWTNLRKRLRALEDSRNAVAHSMVFEFPNVKRSGARTHLRPSIFDATLAIKFDPKRHDNLYLAELTRIKARMERLCVSLQRFWEALPRRRPSHG